MLLKIKETFIIIIVIVIIICLIFIFFYMKSFNQLFGNEIMQIENCNLKSENKLFFIFLNKVKHIILKIRIDDCA